MLKNKILTKKKRRAPSSHAAGTRTDPYFTPKNCKLLLRRTGYECRDWKYTCIQYTRILDVRFSLFLPEEARQRAHNAYCTRRGGGGECSRNLHCPQRTWGKKTWTCAHCFRRFKNVFRCSRSNGRVIVKCPVKNTRIHLRAVSSGLIPFCPLARARSAKGNWICSIHHQAAETSNKTRSFYLVSVFDVCRDDVDDEFDCSQDVRHLTALYTSNTRHSTGAHTTKGRYERSNRILNNVTNRMRNTVRISRGYDKIRISAHVYFCIKPVKICSTYKSKQNKGFISKKHRCHLTAYRVEIQN